MLENLKLKMATLTDLPAIAKVGDELFDHVIKIDRAKEFLMDDRHHLVLAFDADQIVGMASGFHYVHPDKDPVLFINEVGVLERYQNQGIGRTVVRHLYAHGKQFGCQEAWIATEESNQAARKAYLAAGGEEEKELVVLINFSGTMDGRKVERSLNS